MPLSRDKTVSTTSTTTSPRTSRHRQNQRTTKPALRISTLASCCSCARSFPSPPAGASPTCGSLCYLQSHLQSNLQSNLQTCNSDTATLISRTALRKLALHLNFRAAALRCGAAALRRMRSARSLQGGGEHAHEGLKWGS